MGQILLAGLANQAIRWIGGARIPILKPFGRSLGGRLNRPPLFFSLCQSLARLIILQHRATSRSGLANLSQFPLIIPKNPKKKPKTP